MVEHCPDCPHGVKGDWERFISAGLEDYLTKRVDQENLIEILMHLEEQ